MSPLLPPGARSLPRAAMLFRHISVTRPHTGPHSPAKTSTPSCATALCLYNSLNWPLWLPIYFPRPRRARPTKHAPPEASPARNAETPARTTDGCARLKPVLPDRPTGPSEPRRARAEHCNAFNFRLPSLKGIHADPAPRPGSGVSGDGARQPPLSCSSQCSPRMQLAPRIHDETW